MSDPYSALAGGGAQEDDPYAKLAREPAAPEADPYASLAVEAPPVAAAPPPPAAPLETPSVVDYGVSFLKGFPMGAKAQIGSSLQGVAGYSADRPTYPEGQSPLDLAMKGEDFADAYLKGPTAPPRPVTQDPLYQAGSAIQEWGAEAMAPAPGTQFAFDVGSGFGSFGGNVAMALVSPSAAMLAMVASGSGDATERAVKAGATPEQIARAARFGTASGATEFVDALIPMMGTPGKLASLLGQVGAKVVIGAFAEGGQEAVQQLIQNAIAKGIYKPDQNIWEGVGYNALIGFIVGGSAKPVLDRSSIDTGPATSAETSDAYQALVTQKNAPQPVTTPIPQADPSTTSKEPLPPQPSITQPPSISPIEQLFAQPPLTETHAHIIESAPFSPDISSDAAVVAATVKTPPGTYPLQEERLKRLSDPDDDEIMFSLTRTDDVDVPKRAAEKFIAFAYGKDNEEDLLEIRIRQIVYDRTLRKKAGDDIDSEDFAGVRNELAALRKRLREVRTPRYNLSKLTPEAAGQRKGMEDEVVALLGVWKQRFETEQRRMDQNTQAARLAIEQVVGREVADRARFPSKIKMGNDSVNIPAWGGEVSGDIAGFYSPRAERDMTMPLIHVAVAGTSERSLVTAYHESWHAIEGTLTPAEIMTLRSETESMRTFISGHNPRDADLYARAEAEEIWAETAAFYSYSQTYQRAKIYNGPAASVLEKIHQLLQTIKKIVGNYGFRYSGEIFQRFYDGEMAERRRGLPTDMLERWWAQENGAKLSLSQAEGKIERNSARNLSALRKLDPGIEKAPAQFETLHIHDAVGKLFSLGTGGNNTPAGVQQALAHADGLAKRHKWAWGLDRLVDLHPRFKPLLRYAERIREMRTDATRIQNRAHEIAKSWRRLGKQMENLGQLIDWNTNMKYLTPQERAKGVVRMPTQQEFNQAVASFKVNAAGLKIFQETKNFFEVFLKLNTQNAIATAQRTITDPVQLANKIVELQTMEANLLKRPYFPFLRYGEHYVTVRDAQGKVLYFETFERKGARSAQSNQQAAYKRLLAMVAPGEQVSFGKLSETSTPFIGLPPELLESVQSELMAMKDASGNLPGLSAEQVRAIEQLRYQLSPAASFSHRFQNKDYTPGYSHDFLRSFSRYAFHGARYYSRTKYGWALRGHIDEAETLGKGANDNRIGDLVSYMRDHLYNTVLDTKGDFGLFKGAIFLWTFGFSVAGATLNLSQVPMVTYPWLAAKFGGIGKGDARASAAILRATFNVTNQWKWAGNYRSKGYYKPVPGVPQAFEMAAVNYAVETGRISESQAAELAGLAEGSTLLGMGNNKIGRFFQEFMEKAAWMFEMAEQFNRRVTFRAALEMAKAYPNSKAVQEAKNKYADELQQLINSGTFNAVDAESVIAAIHATEQTQFVYARENRPRFMRNRLAGTVFTFQTYYNNMVQLMGANMTSVTPRMLLVIMAMAGLMGLPGAEDLEDVINIIGRKVYGKDFNVRRQLRELLIQASDADTAELLLHGMARRGFGIPALLDTMGEAPGRGLGSGHSNNIPVPLLDRSKSLSMGRALPVNIGNLVDPTDVDKAIAQEAQRASGAVFGVGFNLIKLLAEWNQGTATAKSFDKAMPRALAGATSTWRAYQQERVVMRGGPDGGATLVPYDPRDTEQMSELIARSLGYMPLRESMKWDTVIAEIDARKRLEIHQKVVLENFFEAKMGGRTEEMDKAKERIQKYNDGLPDWGLGYKIIPENLISSVETREREKNAREAGVPTQRRNKPVADYIYETLFPGTVRDVRPLR